MHNEYSIYKYSKVLYLQIPRAYENKHTNHKMHEAPKRMQERECKRSSNVCFVECFGWLLLGGALSRWLPIRAGSLKWGVWETPFSPDGSGDNSPNW